MFFTFFLIVEIVSNHVKHLKYWHKASYLTLPYQHHSKDGTAGPSDAEVTLRESIKNWLFKMHVKNTNLPYTNKKTNSKLKLEKLWKRTWLHHYEKNQLNHNPVTMSYLVSWTISPILFVIIKLIYFKIAIVFFYKLAMSHLFLRQEKWTQKRWHP